MNVLIEKQQEALLNRLIRIEELTPSWRRETNYLEKKSRDSEKLADRSNNIF